MNLKQQCKALLVKFYFHKFYYLLCNSFTTQRHYVLATVASLITSSEVVVIKQLCSGLHWIGTC